MTIYWLIIGVLFLVFMYFVIEYNILTPTKKGLRVLMYHKFDATKKDSLTVATPDFEMQLNYLKEEGYESISCNEYLAFLEGEFELPKKPLIISIDDGYVNNIEFALPLLKMYGFKATVFLPTNYLGKTNEWDKENDPLMSVKQIKQLANDFEFGLHSHTHQSYKHLSLEEIDRDLASCVEVMQSNNVNYIPVIAYPFGAFPKKKETFDAFSELLTKHGIKIGLRIGNAVNPIKPKDLHKVTRIDIQGQESFWRFKTKVNKGRVKMFA